MLTHGKGSVRLNAKAILPQDMGDASICHRTGISGRCGEQCEVYMIYDECGYLEEWRDDIMQVKRTGNKFRIANPQLPTDLVGFNVMKSVSGLLGLKTLVYKPNTRQFDSPSYAFTWPSNAPMEATCHFGCGTVVKDECNSDPGCGMYASMLTRVSIGGYARTDNHVIGIMEGFGWCDIGQNGFASEFGRIVGIVNLDRHGNAITPGQARTGKMHISNLAAMTYFDVQMYSLQQAESLMVMQWLRLQHIHKQPVPMELMEVETALRNYFGK